MSQLLIPGKELSDTHWMGGHEGPIASLHVLSKIKDLSLPFPSLPFPSWK